MEKLNSSRTQPTLNYSTAVYQDLYINAILNNSTVQEETALTRPPLYIAAKILNIYVIPIIIFIGIVGNSLSFMVFVSTQLRRQSSNIYLASLAIADSGFLLCLLLIWLSWVNVDFINTNGICQSVVYVTYVCSFLSVWNVVCFTVERYIVVCYPFKRRESCTTKRAKIVVVSFAVAALFGYSFAIWTAGIEQINGKSVCMPSPKHFHLISILNNIDTVITLIIPSLLTIALNMRIGVAIYRASARRKTFLTRGQTTTSQNSSGQTRQTASNNSQFKITRMLLTVSTVFIILNLPTHAIRVQDFVAGFMEKNHSASKQKLHWQEVLQFFYYVNFAINFFLYSLCGRNFRLGLRQVTMKFRSLFVRRDDSVHDPPNVLSQDDYLSIRQGRSSSFDSKSARMI